MSLANLSSGGMSLPKEELQSVFLLLLSSPLATADCVPKQKIRNQKYSWYVIHPSLFWSMSLKRACNSPSIGSMSMNDNAYSTVMVNSLQFIILCGPLSQDPCLCNLWMASSPQWISRKKLASSQQVTMLSSFLSYLKTLAITQRTSFLSDFIRTCRALTIQLYSNCLLRLVSSFQSTQSICFLTLLAKSWELKVNLTTRDLVDFTDCPDLTEYPDSLILLEEGWRAVLVSNFSQCCTVVTVRSQDSILRAGDRSILWSDPLESIWDFLPLPVTASLIKCFPVATASSSSWMQQSSPENTCGEKNLESHVLQSVYSTNPSELVSIFSKNLMRRFLSTLWMLSLLKVSPTSLINSSWVTLVLPLGRVLERSVHPVSEEQPRKLGTKTLKLWNLRFVSALKYF